MIAIDLSKPMDGLLNDTAEEIKANLYRSQEALGQSSRPGLKLIHVNRSPFVTTAKAMTQENADRLGLDGDTCLENYRRLSQHTDLALKLSKVFEDGEFDDDQDVDHALYSGGFLNDEDRRWCEQVLEATPDALAALSDQTQHPRLKSQLFRYRARNFPNTLTFDEMTKWQRHRQARLTDAQSPASITLEPYMLRLEQLAQVHSDNPEKQAILRALYQYAENL